MAKLIDGKEISKNIKDELKEKVATLKKEGKEYRLEQIRLQVSMLEIKKEHVSMWE